MQHSEAAVALAGPLAQQPNESNPGSTLSVGQQRNWEYAQLVDFMEQMAGRYPNQDMEAAAQNYLFDYNRLAQIHGLSAVKTALLNRRIKPGQRFFPSPDEIAEELESMAANAKADSLKANPYVPDPECKHVSGGGWRRFISADGEYAVSRCACWNKWKGIVPVVDTKVRAAGE